MHPLRHGVIASVGLVASTAMVMAAGSAPVAHDLSVTSLYRADASWTVTTSVTLTAKDSDGTTWTFKLVHPEALKDLDGSSRFVCPDASGADLLGQARMLLSLPCQYHPPVDFTGDETFQYQVQDSEGNLSQPASITATVKRSGLRWELLTNGTTAVGSDSAPGGVPGILAKNSQDLLFRLDWEIANPQTASLPDPTKRVGTDLASTRSVHFEFETGVLSQPEGATAQTLTQNQATSSPAAAQGNAGSSAPAAAPTVANKRKATFGGELDYSRVVAPQSGSTYLEVGAVFKGNIDASVEGATSSQDVGSSILALTRNGTGVGSFRGQVAVRAALKQYSDNPLRTSITHAGVTTFPKNSDNFVVAEFGYLRDTSLVGLRTLNITENRYIVRITASPELPGTPGHMRPTIGIELTGGFSTDSPKQVKFIYGMNTGTLGLFH
jgi:hypothetical protein